ncbi:ABC-2 type transport system permease protein [Prosthecobacter debontii]|uniref:ABC-2 type transport system permease protein n=1 Tax=Prosthecobacter debontii TaxID=48467 RepID=A0A1T4Y5F1_9BACT|nr:ABC transporter permease [Prosthecobacter debontii]SKA96960.1 ABC-2 type transport system permease protein [Prosthecobacter debontii]
MILFFRQWQSELLKLFARRRTYIGFGAFLLLEIVLLIVFRLQGVERIFERMISRQGQSFEHYFSALTLAQVILGFSVVLLGSIYLALVSGDIVAKENEDGHYRLLLVRPVSRVRLLGIKYLTCVGYTIALVQFITWTAFLLGLSVKGWGGGFFVMIPDAGLLEFYDWTPGLKRFALASFFLSLGMTSISSIAFFLSCFPIKPAAATIAALSYFLIDRILRETGFMESYDHFLLTKHIVSWARVLSETIPWPVIIRDFTVLGAVNLSLFILGAAVFQSRDLKS